MEELLLKVSTMTYAELQDEAGKLGIPAVGKTEDLRKAVVEAIEATTSVADDTTFDAPVTTAGPTEAEVQAEVDKKVLEILATKEAEKQAEEASKMTVDDIKRANRKKSNDLFKKKRYGFKFFKDKNRYKDDVIIGVNGKLDQIQRGKQVYLTGPAYATLLNSERQKSNTADMITGLTAEFEAKAKSL